MTNHNNPLTTNQLTTRHRHHRAKRATPLAASQGLQLDEQKRFKSRYVSGCCWGNLRHPIKLRLVLYLTILAAWYFLFYSPLSDEMAVTQARINKEQKRITTARGRGRPQVARGLTRTGCPRSQTSTS